MQKSVLTIGATFLLLLSACSSNPTTVQNNSNDSSSSSIQSSQTASVAPASWVRIDRQTYWHNDDYFTDDSYNFPAIAFEHPSNWKFNCCGDMDNASQHLLCADDACDKAYVKITNYGLRGCPSGKNDCSIDEVVSKTAQQKYDELAASIQADAHNQILPAIHLQGLDVDALAYTKNAQSRVYLMNLSDDVLEVEFLSGVETDDGFVAEFLSRLTWDRD